MKIIDEDALLQRKPVAAALTERGIPITGGTLATMATKGKGPPFRRFGKKALYRWGDVLAWVEMRMSPMKGSPVQIDRRSTA